MSVEYNYFLKSLLSPATEAKEDLRPQAADTHQKGTAGQGSWKSTALPHRSYFMGKPNCSLNITADLMFLIPTFSPIRQDLAIPQCFTKQKGALNEACRMLKIVNQ